MACLRIACLVSGLPVQYLFQRKIVESRFFLVLVVSFVVSAAHHMAKLLGGSQCKQLPALPAWVSSQTV